jgi:formate hydrogenlyase subunit 6/NADH:ubiquinone oxidoreductase subunit I
MAKKSRVAQIFQKAAACIFIKPATSEYPFEKTQMSENFRGQPAFNSSLCIGCGTCSRNCPANAVEMVIVGGKKFPQFNLGKCIFCYQCVDTCPKKALTQTGTFELATTDKSTLIIKPQLITA